MKIILIGANGKIGKLVQKALAGAGHEIVKVGRKSGDSQFQVEIENRESVRKLYQAVGSFDAVAIAAGQTHGSDQSCSGGDPVHQRERILHVGVGHAQ